MAETGQVRYEDVVEGMMLPVSVRRPSSAQLFLYSAATHNPHRVHYDNDYAISEGHPGPLEHGPLHGAMLCSYLVDWIGVEGFLQSVSFRNRSPVIAGETVTVRGQVTRKEIVDGKPIVEIKVWEEDERGKTTVDGSAVICLP